jgi:hypothetical protein
MGEHVEASNLLNIAVVHSEAWPLTVGGHFGLMPVIAAPKEMERSGTSRLLDRSFLNGLLENIKITSQNAVVTGPKIVTQAKPITQ